MSNFYAPIFQVTLSYRNNSRWVIVINHEFMRKMLTENVINVTSLRSQ